MKKFFAILSIFAATCTVANAQQPVILSFDSDTIVAKDYETLGKLQQTTRLGNTYNKYLVRKDPQTGEKQRYLLSSKPITGFEVWAGVEAHLYNKYVTALPMLGIGSHGPKWILRGGAGIGQTQYMDKASDKYGKKYWSVVARGEALYKVHSSAANNQMLERHYDAIGMFCEYDNRRNSTAETIESATQYTVEENWVQGSSYAIGFEYLHGITWAKSATRAEIGAYIGVGRDYENEGTITVLMGGITLKISQVLSKTKKTKLGERVLRAY